MKTSRRDFLQAAGAGLAAAAATCALRRTAAAGADAPRPKPNLIFVMVDDMGKAPVGCYGRSDKSQTPHLDRLAKGGVRFRSFYSMPQCVPTRVALLTGQYPFRNGWVNHYDVPRWNLKGFNPKTNPCIGSVLKAAGYRTCIAGKWQISDFRREPKILNACGFDEFCVWTGGERGNPASHKRYWNPYLHTATGSRTHQGQYGPDVCNRFVLDFLRKHREEPMFVYYPMILQHGPMERRPIDLSPPGYIDHLVGKVVKTLDETRLRRDTILIFTTDNGPRKGKTVEDGCCEPFIVNGPGRVPAGVVTDALADITDILPTFAELAGAKPPAGHVLDGVSMAKLLTGRAKDTPRRWILAMGGGRCRRGASKRGEPAPGYNTARFRDRVLRDKRFKLYVGTDRKPARLVDLQADPSEKTNILDSKDPAARAALTRLLAAVAALPQTDANPRY